LVSTGRAAVLAGSFLSLVATVNGYRPLARKGFLSAVTVACGVLVSELPRQLLIGQVSLAAVLWRRLRGRSRWVACLLSAASWLGLAGLIHIGRGADGPLTEALNAQLGTERSSKSERPWPGPSPAVATAKTPGLLRMVRIHRAYAHDADIRYGEYGSANLLDIWRLPNLDASAKSPVLLQVPGGAWTRGNKRGQAHPLMSHLAELGWICVSINYRLSPRYTWPDHIVDVKRAIAWVKGNISDYGGDPDFIAITGGSAGAHLSSLAALTANDPQFQPGFSDADTSVQAAVPFYGVYDFTRTDGALHPMMVPFLEKKVMKRTRSDSSALYRSASPVSYVRSDAPPFFVLHGRNDSFIPAEQARSFVARLREVSRQPVVYTELPCAQHAFDVMGSVRAAHAAVAVERFLAAVYSSDPPRSA
jgi:acetyl esterase/lipase